MTQQNTQHSRSARLGIGYAVLILGLALFIYLVPRTVYRILDSQNTHKEVVQESDVSRTKALYIDPLDHKKPFDLMVDLAICLRLTEKADLPFVGRVHTTANSGSDVWVPQVSLVEFFSEGNNGMFCSVHEWVLADGPAWQNDFYFYIDSPVPAFSHYAVGLAGTALQAQVHECNDGFGCNYLHVRWERNSTGTINFFTP
jgi:hypothetical protein